MAIYYVDPHATVNGTGTWASPFSTSAAARTGVVAGDEIRVRGVALTSLLTATVYTATVTNNYQLTITAGGGLGADFVAGNVVYIPAFDTFFKIYSVATNVIQAYTTTSMLPIYDSSVYGTSITIRKVDTTTYPPGAASSVLYVGGALTVNNITISDCWTDAVTRVTDGTVKTLLNSSSTGGMTCYPGSSSNSTATTGWTVDLSNTHVMNTTGTSNGTVQVAIYTSNSTYTINQIYSHYYYFGTVTFGTTNAPIYNTSVTLTKCTSAVLGTNNSKNCTLTVADLACYYMDFAVVAQSALLTAVDFTLNLGDIVTTSLNSAGALVTVLGATSTTINLNGMIDTTTTTYPSLVFWGYGKVTITYGAGFQIKGNKRTVTRTTLTNLAGYSQANFIGTRFLVPAVPTPTGFTVTTPYNYTTLVQNNVDQRTLYQPKILQVDLPTPTGLTANTPYGNYNGPNVVATFRDGSAAREILSIVNSGYSTTAAVSTSFPVVALDAATFRTTGPSLRALLTTRVAAAWVNRAVAVKTIKIPCTSGVAYTVAGYIRNNIAGFANGDVRMNIVLGDDVVTSVNMTTASNGAWEAFTLTFTAAQTAEYTLAWEMFYTAAGSIWLDDLTIS